jgi:hypothetical protein
MSAADDVSVGRSLDDISRCAPSGADVVVASNSSSATARADRLREAGFMRRVLSW